MPLISLRCPNCGASLEFNEGTKFGFCMYCGNKVVLVEESRKVEIDNSSMVANWRKLCIEAFNHGEYEEAKAYANKILEVDFDDQVAKEIKSAIRGETFDIESCRPDDSIMANVETAVLAGKIIDYHTEPFNRDSVVEVLNKMSRLDSLKTNDQIVAHYANACALTAMAILNEPDPALILSMLESLKTMKIALLKISGRLDSKESTNAKNQEIMAYDRNVSSLYVQLKDYRVAKNKELSEQVRARLAGDPKWSSVAARAADALMEKSTGVQCKGAKAFEMYVKVLCKRSYNGVRLSSAR